MQIKEGRESGRQIAAAKDVLAHVNSSLHIVEIGKFRYMKDWEMKAEIPERTAG